MPRGPRVKGTRGIYHIMLRGANKQEIFHDDEDRKTFLDLLVKYKMKSIMAVFAWCLMNNHVHLLLKEGNEDISVTMKRIEVSFVSYYNRKYQTTGHLFQDRFRSENVETNRYLLTVIRYIHQNPVKAGMVGKVEHWKWSSCLGYYGKGVYPNNLLDVDSVYEIISDNISIAKERFEEFNERISEDKCLDFNAGSRKNRLSDDEAKPKIMRILGDIEVAQVKSLPRAERNKLLREIKGIKGISIRQAARILGLSKNLILRA